MEIITLRDEFIKLGQALYDGDVVSYDGQEIKIQK